jgi:hypothetical protein
MSADEVDPRFDKPFIDVKGWCAEPLLHLFGWGFTGSRTVARGGTDH